MRLAEESVFEWRSCGALFHAQLLGNDVALAPEAFTLSSCHQINKLRIEAFCSRPGRQIAPAFAKILPRIEVQAVHCGRRLVHVNRDLGAQLVSTLTGFETCENWRI